MVRDGWLYGVGLLVVAGLVFLLTKMWFLALPAVLLAAFFLWFFRDPTRTVPTAPGLIVSPADGLVTEAEWVETTLGGRLRVSIFLNVFDVHVNRMPISGRVSVVDYRKGEFLNAMNPESALNNEQTMITVKNEHCEVSFKQIAGLLARRIVCNVKVGDAVERGQRMGLIKFGSRCDVLMPAEAQLKVKVGTRVLGGTTVLAALDADNLPRSGRDGFGLMADEASGLEAAGPRLPSRGMYVLPSAFTAGNIAMGFYAMVESMHGAMAPLAHYADGTGNRFFDHAALAIGFAVLLTGSTGG